MHIIATIIQNKIVVQFVFKIIKTIPWRKWHYVLQKRNGEKINFLRNLRSSWWTEKLIRFSPVCGPERTKMEKIIFDRNLKKIMFCFVFVEHCKLFYKIKKNKNKNPNIFFTIKIYYVSFSNFISFYIFFHTYTQKQKKTVYLIIYCVQKKFSFIDVKTIFIFFFITNYKL